MFVQRDDSHFGDSYEYIKKKIQGLKSNVIKIYKLFVLPGGNGWLIWSTPFLLETYLELTSLHAI